ncbi:MAG: hypothetical protein Q9219_003413 [cf. Caloplaca sp. 3 TL-2023]
MIERATTCLENGGKHIVRAPRTPFRTRRHLHSTFWSHGAGNINLPSWWQAFLQVPSTDQPRWSSKGDPHLAFGILAENTSLGLLDFLYPVQTIALIRKLVDKTSLPLKYPRRSRLPSQCSRPYTSTAESPVSAPANHEDVAHFDIAHEAFVHGSISGSIPETMESQLSKKFHEVLSDKHDATDTQQIWQMYEDLEVSSISITPGDLDRLFRRLRDSSTTFDARKIRQLFNTVAWSDRRTIHYKCAVSAALQQDDISGAVAMHEEATFRGQGSFELPIIKHAVKNSDWENAVAIWQIYKACHRAGSHQPSIWNDVKTLPLSDLLGKAKEALEVASRTGDAPTGSFAHALTQSALSVRHKEFDQWLQTGLVDMAQSTQQPNPKLFKAAILQSFSMGAQSLEHSQAALDLYSFARQRADFTPDLELLNAILQRCHDSHYSQGMYQVLEDFRNHCPAIPRRAYRLLMSQLARHGDFDTVDQLFRESMDRFGSDDISILAPQLLFACFRRAEVSRAEGVIENLRQQYDYVPDLRAWNLLLATYVRVGDVDGARTVWNGFAAMDLRPNSSSYGSLMSMFSRRGDYEPTDALYGQALSKGIKPNVEMVSSLVQALASNDRLDEAEEMAEEAMKMDLEVPRHPNKTPSAQHTLTRIWNTLLGHYAMKGHLEKVFDLQKRMQELAIVFDDITYAALMQCFCIKRLPAAAQRILKHVMPKQGIRPTALHFAIVMGGFVANQDHPSIYGLQLLMKRQGIKSTFSTDNAILRSASQLDLAEHKSSGSGAEDFQAVRAETLLTKILDNLDPMDLATPGPTKFARSNPLDVALRSSYFPYLIMLYGRHRAFGKVEELFDRFITTNQKFNADVEASPPIEMLSALMVSYTHSGAHDEAERCWQLAVNKSQDLARKATAHISQPGWVLHKYRFILSLPLTQYMDSLEVTGRVDELENIIASLQRDGFELSVHNWNKYVQVLVEAKNPVLAFRICEQQLIAGWPGWDHFRSKRRMMPKIRKHWVPKSWELNRPFPHYVTFVHLAKAYLDASRMAYGAGREMLQQFERVAPKTMEGVYGLPRTEDQYQSRLLDSNG